MIDKKIVHWKNNNNINNQSETEDIIFNNLTKKIFKYNKFFKKIKYNIIGKEKINYDDINVYFFKWSLIFKTRHFHDHLNTVITWCIKNNALLVIDNAHESRTILDYDILDKLKKYENLKYLIIATPEYNNEYYKGIYDVHLPSFRYRLFCETTGWNKLNYKSVNYEKTEKKYFFSSFMGNILKTHRVLTFLLLKKYKLYEHSFVSHFLRDWENFIDENSIISFFKKNFDEDDILSLYKEDIYTNNLYDENDIQDILKHDFYRDYFPNQIYQSYFNLVTETLQNYSFVTEKTWKPVLTKVPFYIIGGPNIHNDLTSYGFELFPELFDYSMEKNENMHKRIMFQMKHLNILLNEPKSIFYQKSIIDKLEHNYHNFLNFTSDDEIFNTLMGIYAEH